MGPLFAIDVLECAIVVFCELVDFPMVTHLLFVVPM
jgi:hypothetical protein